MTQHKLTASPELYQAVDGHTQVLDDAAFIMAAGLDIKNGIQLSSDDGANLMLCGRFNAPILAQNVKMRNRLKELGEDWDSLDMSVANKAWDIQK